MEAAERRRWLTATAAAVLAAAALGAAAVHRTAVRATKAAGRCPGQQQQQQQQPPAPPAAAAQSAPGPAAPEQGAAGPRELRLLPLGDSITFGQGDQCDARPPCEHHLNLPRYDCLSGWRGPLWQKLRPAAARGLLFVGTQRNGPPESAMHEGWPGYTITQLIARAGQWQVLNPDIVMVTAGTNDICLGTGGDRPEAAAQVVAERLDHIISLAMHSLRNRRLGLVAVGLILPLPNPLGAFPQWGPGGRLYNKRIADIVKARRARGEPIVLAPTDDPKIGCPTEHCCGGMHPYKKGYARMAEIWAEVLAPLVRRMAAGAPALSNATA
eukprot:TRINITY_DN12792_c0_g1_i2.p1 TRINITY_DN12792_c0_g1~~TRINITY_DN12792_c0_g1_i2.p1  ORF type:complete len:349 (+),score=125.18 TRINITY_DN12792_c0_g1_i2:71-1048(+)